MDKKWLGLFITLCMAVVVIGAAIIFALNLRSNQGQRGENPSGSQNASISSSESPKPQELQPSSEWETMAKKVIDVISSEQEEFSNATPDERKKIAEKIMDELVEQGVLKEENIGFDEENNVYQFITNDGALNIISLNDFDPEYMGSTNEKKNSDNGAVKAAGSTGGESTGNGEYQYFPNGYPYTDEELLAEDLDMLFLTNVYPIKSQDYINYHNLYEKYTFQLCKQAYVKYKDIPETTVEELKTCLKGYDYISLDFHGLHYSLAAKIVQTIQVITSELVVSADPISALGELYGMARLESYLKDLCDEEETTFLLILEQVWIGADIRYKDDLASGRIIRNLSDYGYCYHVTPLFFHDYYKENDLKETIVYLGACDGYYNETLPATFMGCGAEAVVGYNHPVLVGYAYNMEWRFLHWLMYGGTVEEAVAFAKKIEGDKDYSEYQAELKAYPKGKDAVLIKNAECTRKHVLIEESMTYEDAVKYCDSIGGKIASILYPAEQRAIDALLKEGEKNCYWIGLQKGEEGKLFWDNLGSESIYHSHWAADEPSGDGTQVMVYGRPDEEKGSQIGEWNDVTYDPNMHEGFYAAEQFGIVCELSGTDPSAVGIGEATPQSQPATEGTETTSAVETTASVPATEVPETTTEEAHAAGLPQVGDIITFGSYPQEADGTVKPIEWRVLAVEDGKALLISRNGLDAKPYNEEYTKFTWETCTLRKWLNEVFYKEAFSKGEQNKISLTHVDNKDNKGYGTGGGNDTEDKLFPLSMDEVKAYFASYEDQICYPSEFAVKNNCLTGSNGVCLWWLRDLGSNGKGAVYVTFGGREYSDGCLTNGSRITVRPAFWYAPNGEVASEDVANEEPVFVLTKSKRYYDDGENAGSPHHFNSWVEWDYDAAGNMLRKTSYNEDGSIKSWTEYAYDAAGNMLKETSYNEAGSINGWTEYAYDAAGNMLKETPYNKDGSIGGWTEYAYDAAGNMLKTHYNKDGCATHGNEYNSAGEYIKYFEYSNGEFKGWIDYSNGNTKYYKADGSFFGHSFGYQWEPWYEQNPDFEYDLARNMVKRTIEDSDGNIKDWAEYEYDNSGNLIKSTEESIFTYDTFYQSAEWHRVEHEYDIAGKTDKWALWQKFDPPVDLQPLGFDEEHQYDSEGKLIAYLWVWGETRYDTDGKPVIKKGLTSENINAGYYWYEYAYDADGNPIKQTYYHLVGNYYSNSRGRIKRWREWEYDDYGNLLKTTVYNPDGSVMYVEEENVYKRISGR